MSVVAEEYVVEVDMVINYMNAPAVMKLFIPEVCILPADQWRLLSFQQKNNIQEKKICKIWRGFNVPPVGYKIDNEGEPVVYSSFYKTSTHESNK